MAARSVTGHIISEPSYAARLRHETVTGINSVGGECYAGKENLKWQTWHLKKILGVSARNREHRGSRFMVNPTTGTLEVSIDLRLKARKRFEERFAA